MPGFRVYLDSGRGLEKKPVNQMECVIWSFDDMGLGEKVILYDKKIEEISML